MSHSEIDIAVDMIIGDHKVTKYLSFGFRHLLNYGTLDIHMTCTEAGMGIYKH